MASPKYWDSSGSYVNDSVINDNLIGNLNRVISAATENVNNYVINQGNLAINGAAASNYHPLIYQSALFNITPAPLAINANSAVKTYGVNDPLFTFAATGFINAVVDGIPISDDANNSLTGNLGRFY